MRFKHLFNIVMYSFFMIVPLVPFKAKVFFFPLSADFIIGGAAILMGILSILFDSRKDRDRFSIIRDKKIMTLGLLILLFLALALVSVTYAENKGAAVSEALRFMEYVMIFYLILINADEAFINRGLFLIYMAIVFSALYGIVQFIFNLSNFEAGAYFNRGRVFATFANPNYWGAAVNLIIFYPIILMIENKDERRVRNIVLLILLLVNLVLSFTRGSWLGFGLGLVIIALIRYRKALVSLPFLAGALFIIPFTRSRIMSIINFKSDTWGTSMQRIKLWKTTYYMFRDHFWTGVGNGNYLTWYPRYIKKYPQLNLWRPEVTAHNSYLKIFAELGIFGGLLFAGIYGALLYITVTIYKNTGRYKIHALALLGFWTAYLFQNFFNNLMFIPQLNIFAWIITAMLFKGAYIENQEVK